MHDHKKFTKKGIENNDSIKRSFRHKWKGL